MEIFNTHIKNQNGELQTTSFDKRVFHTTEKRERKKGLIYNNVKLS